MVETRVGVKTEGVETSRETQTGEDPADQLHNISPVCFFFCVCVCLQIFFL